MFRFRICFSSHLVWFKNSVPFCFNLIFCLNVKLLPTTFRQEALRIIIAWFIDYKNQVLWSDVFSNRLPAIEPRLENPFTSYFKTYHWVSHHFTFFHLHTYVRLNYPSSHFNLRTAIQQWGTHYHVHRNVLRICGRISIINLSGGGPLLYKSAK